MNTQRAVRLASLSFVLFGLANSCAHASTITASTVRAFGPNHFNGMTVDSVTGKVYESTDYAGTAFTTYANLAAFESGSSSGTVNWGAPVYGTYLAAHNGSVYARTNTQTAQCSRFGPELCPIEARTTKFNASTGAAQATQAIAGMGGFNVADTFSWGGNTAANPMNDGAHLLIVGGIDGSTDWRVSTFDYDLTQLNSVVFATSISHEFAFAMNNYIFFGDTFMTNHISKRLDATTGAVVDVDFQLAGTGNYLTNASYDSLSDSLYFSSLVDNKYSKITAASRAFGLAAPEPTVDVPEPSTVILFGMAGAALLAARRRKTLA